MINTYEMSTTELQQEVQEIRQKFDYENLTYKEKIELNKRLKQIEIEIDERFLNC
jgi:hypothetical protein